MRTTLTAAALAGLLGLALLTDAAARDDEKVEPQAPSAEAKALAGKKVHLKFDDTPLDKAVEQIAKETGYSLKLHDPEGKLKGKKVTLDTGKTTFWDALAQFCDKAGLTDGEPNRRVRPGVRPLPAPLPGVKAQPLPAPLPPVEAQPAKPVKEAPRKQDEKPDGDDATDELPAQAPAKPAADAPIPVAPVQGGGGGQAPAVLPAPGGGPAIMPAVEWVPVEPGQIVLVPGKAAKGDAKTSLRVRPADASALRMPVALDKDRINLDLELTLEPKLRWHSLGAVKITKATDDNDQKLDAVEVKFDRPAVRPLPAPLPLPGGGPGVAPGVAMPAIGMAGSANGLSRTVPVQFEKGKKATKSFKEITGTVEAKVLAEAEALVVVENVMKMAGKTVKGKKGGAVTINKASKNKDGVVEIEFTLDLPDAAKVVPERQINVPIPPDVGPLNPRVAPQPFPGGGVQPLPVDLPLLLPPVEGQKPDADDADEPALAPPAQAKELPLPAQVDPAPAQPGFGGGAPAFVGPGALRYAVNGLTLQDDKGNTVYAWIGYDQAKLKGNRNGPRDYVARYKAGKGMPAEPTKLVFTGRQIVELKVPFTLKDVEVK